MTQNSNLQKSKITHWCQFTTNDVAKRSTGVGKITHTINNNAAKQTKLAKMLTNEHVKRWHDNLARGSPLTAEVRVRRLGAFCSQYKMRPGQIIDKAGKDIRAVSDMLEDHVTYMESKNYSPTYILDYVKAIKSWLRHFDIEIKRKIKVSNSHKTPTLEGERVPNGEEMAEVYSRASIRERAMISLIAKSGVRLEVIGNYDGTDGLRIKDVEDLVIYENKARCTKVPVKIIIRPEISKARHRYFTFCTASGMSHVLAHINDRLACGESINENSPVIAPDRRYNTYRGSNKNKPFLPTKRVSFCIRRVFRPRFQWRPYVLRAYFDTQMLIAESRGKVAGDFRAFFMGHRGNIEARYTTNKGILSEILVKEMRQSFERSQEFLDLEIEQTDPILEQKEKVQQAIENATPDELGAMLKALEN